MKTLRNLIQESESQKHKVTILIEDVDLTGEDDYISVFEILDNIEGVKCFLVQKAKNMVDVYTSINVYENVTEFSDLVLEPLRNEEYKVKLIKST